MDMNELAKRALRTNHALTGSMRVLGISREEYARNLAALQPPRIVCADTTAADEDTLDWDVTIPPPPRPTRTVKVRVKRGGKRAPHTREE